MPANTNYAIRAAIVEDDADGITAVYNASWPEPSSAERMRENAARRADGELYRCLVAVDAIGAIIGYCEARH
ncbi:MAG TPA: hypothetical protein VKQ36_00685, partial [Ktedonobacterales bacterium]|nr:hypothetical protein [Ktedonobacterales bacterium]